MSFLNPSYLWALLGLLIPLAIHLWSKKEGKTIKIGSIKLLREEDSKQSSSISLNELLLLLFRLLIVAIVVLIMAEPQFKKDSKNTPLTYIVEPSLMSDTKVTPLIDSLKINFPVLLLQNQFPEITQLDTTNLKTPNYWQLAKQMETLKTDSIIVFTNARIKGLTGKRPTINKPVDWITFNSKPSEEILVEAILKKDSVQLLTALSKLENLSFKKETISLNSNKIDINESKNTISFNQNNKLIKYDLLKEAPLKVLLYHEKKFENDARYIEATLNAISKHLKTAIEIKLSTDSLTLSLSDYDRIIWLGDNPSNKLHPKILTHKADELANSIIADGATKNISYITQSLNPENIIDKDFSIELLSWLDLRPYLERNTIDYDYRKVSKAELLPVFKQDSKTSNLYIETWSIVKWLCILLGCLLIIERVIAHTRKQ